MDGVHDMGGMDGFGPIEPEDDEPVFHAEWEGRVLALTRSMNYAGDWTVDETRFAKESIHPAAYLAASYYELGLMSMETVLINNGIVTREELDNGVASTPGAALPRKMTFDKIDAAMRRGSYYREPSAAALFMPGDRVRTTNIHPPTHTRLPRYARDKVGVVEKCHGCHMFPDAAMTAGQSVGEWLYTVIFTGDELWGPDGDPTSSISIEAFESYLVKEHTDG